MEEHKAVVVLIGVGIKGVVYFHQQDNLTQIHGQVEGLTHGKHGFHIHETGDLTDHCQSLCAHFNPTGTNHGDRKDEERHIGDLGNIEADDQGIAKFDFTDPLIKLTGEHSVIGRSVIVHADEDDLGRGGHTDSLTTGHAGKRLACGVIGIQKIK